MEGKIGSGDGDYRLNWDGCFQRESVSGACARIRVNWMLHTTPVARAEFNGESQISEKHIAKRVNGIDFSRPTNIGAQLGETLHRTDLTSEDTADLPDQLVAINAEKHRYTKSLRTLVSCVSRCRCSSLESFRTSADAPNSLVALANAAGEPMLEQFQKYTKSSSASLG